MNPIIILVAGVALVLGWLSFDRVYNPTKAASLKLEPTVRETRTERLLAVRALAFFFILNFMLTAVGVLVGALIVALVAPPKNANFVVAYGQALIQAGGAADGPLNPMALGGAIIGFGAAIGAVFISQKYIRGESILDLGLRYYKVAPLDMIAGLLFGPIAFAIVFVTERSAGYVVGTRGPTFDAGQIIIYLLTFLLVAVSEEIVVRGYILRTLNTAWDGAIAIVASSVFWGLAHLLNPHSSPIAALDITVAGLVFAYAYVISGRLWLPIALHFAWNFAEGVIFGFPVSGYLLPNAIFQPYVEGPNAVTGDGFGPEGGVIMMLALAVVGGLLFGWSKVRQAPVPKPQNTDK